MHRKRNDVVLESLWENCLSPIKQFLLGGFCRRLYFVSLLIFKIYDATNTKLRMLNEYIWPLLVIGRHWSLTNTDSYLRLHHIRYRKIYVVSNLAAS